jgi:hypothetical protein
MSSTTKRIPIAAARRFAQRHNLTHLLILGADSSGVSHVLTYGKSTADSEAAAIVGNKLKKLLGWPDSMTNAVPARVRRERLKEEPMLDRAALAAATMMGEQYSPDQIGFYKSIIHRGFEEIAKP